MYISMITYKDTVRVVLYSVSEVVESPMHARLCFFG